jgi:hypothetical protein
MEIFCLALFKDELERLKKKKAYKEIEHDIITYFFNKDLSQLMSGTRLNNSETEPYIKKRLEGRGGYRVYYFVKTKDGKVYLMFVHPKTGPEGSDNITDQSKAKIYKDILAAIKVNNLFQLTLAGRETQIIFKKPAQG